MESYMQSHHWERRMPDWFAAGAAGLVGGASVIVSEFFWSTTALNESPWRPTHKIAAMITGRGALEEMSLFSFSIVGTALVLHLVLDVLMGMILGVIIAPFHLDSGPDMLTVAGVVLGIVAYVINFYGTTAAFPWFASERGSEPLPANLPFGVVTTIMYGMLEWRMPKPMH